MTVNNTEVIWQMTEQKIDGKKEWLFVVKWLDQMEDVGLAQRKLCCLSRKCGDSVKYIKG